jgi:hypothetical protein
MLSARDNASLNSQQNVSIPTQYSFYLSPLNQDPIRMLSRVLVAIVGTAGTGLPASWVHTDEGSGGFQALCSLSASRELPDNYKGRLYVSRERINDAAQIGHIELCSSHNSPGDWSFFSYYPLQNIINNCRGCGLGSLFEVGAITALRQCEGVVVRNFSASKLSSDGRKAQLSSVGLEVERQYAVDDWLAAHKISIDSRKDRIPEPLQPDLSSWTI